jgi:hypothetical protein
MSSLKKNISNGHLELYRRWGLIFVVGNGGNK